MKALVACVLLTGLSFSSAAAHAQAAETPTGKLQSVADSLSGNWKLKVKFEPSPSSPNGIEGSGEEVWHLTPGALVLIDEESFSAGPMKMQIVGLFWADGASHNLRALDCNNQNQHTCDLKDAKDGMTVQWNGKELIVEEPESFEGKPMTSRIVWSNITPTSFLEEGFIGPPGGPFKKGMTIQASRK
ncbi:hypothetical protein [Occallatibacter riparius]|uniref:DUF1579 domain-containing protein n=1 Tax=Occallatibacter riparius TaxID=1002689 RepID=A0A9J7BMW3_9BACT|nr:hypothetical protein [Occallatibacter riparius]UWZ83098.1 hypothetical protein MOP44_21315 [Occallatibacter riparius]